MMAALSILGALVGRQERGEGEEIQMSMYETLASVVLTNHIGPAVFVPALGPPIYERVASPDRRPFRTKDGFVSVLPYSDAHWSQFFDCIGQPHLTASELYNSVSARTANIRQLYQLVDSALMERTTAEWLLEFRSRGLPCAAIQGPADLLADPSLYESGVLQQVEHPSEGSTISVRAPIGYSNVLPVPLQPAPRAGEHTAELLEEIGLDSDQINLLLQCGAAVQS
jgi:crotonobetainyl-CoA:carnitine CoA-transferase CaiB-like acyl-CoA transferase